MLASRVRQGLVVLQDFDAAGAELRLLDVWTAPSFLEAVTSGKVGTHDITEAAPR
jgi:hypothetical protein